MFFAAFRGTENQVWPGSGINIFSSPGTVSISVVSTFSNYLNFERWYVSAPANSVSAGAWDSSLNFRAATPLPVRPGDAPRADFAESYIDQAVLTNLDWQSYSEPVLPAGYQEKTYYAFLTPVLVSPGQPTPMFGEAIGVWVQFRLHGDDIVQIAWFFTGTIVWPDRGDRLPSGFLIFEHGTPFDPVPAGNIPTSGKMHIGGMRPAPWPG